MNMRIRKTRIEDVTAVHKMYCLVASVPGGLARLNTEISEQYVREFVEKSISSGVALVAENPNGMIIGEIHAYCSGLYFFSHVLTDLTVAVDPTCRNQGVAKTLFENFFRKIEQDLNHIERVELISRESNQIAITFYESLGFRKEGRLEKRIKNVDGSMEADIPMGWTKKSQR